MQVPSNLVSGEPFKQGVVNKINDILSYLRSQRIVGDNDTIVVNQNVNGITIKSIVKQGVNQESEHHPFKPYFYNVQGNIQIELEEGYIYFRKGGTYSTYNGNDYHIIHYTPYTGPGGWANSWPAQLPLLEPGSYTLWGVLRSSSLSFFFAKKETSESWIQTRQYTIESAINNEDFLSFKVCDIMKCPNMATEMSDSESTFIDNQGNAYYIENEYVLGNLFLEQMGRLDYKVSINFSWSLESFLSNNSRLGYVDSIDDFKAPVIFAGVNIKAYSNLRNKYIRFNLADTIGASYTPQPDEEATLYLVLRYKDDNFPGATLTFQKVLPYPQNAYIDGQQYTGDGPIYDKTTKTYTFLLASVRLERPYNLKLVKYYLESDIFFDTTNGRIKTSEIDYKYEYLSQKIKDGAYYIDSGSYPQEIASSAFNNLQTFNYYGSGYIKGKKYWDQGEKIQLVWDHTNISGYAATLRQKLTHPRDGSGITPKGKPQPQWDVEQAVIPGNYISSVDSTTSDGTITHTFNVNKDALFSDFHITGTGYAHVTGSGNRWNVDVQNGGSGGSGGSNQFYNVTGTSPIQITSSTAGNITTYNVALDIEGNGIIVFNSGSAITLTIPTSGNQVLTCQNGSLSWVEYSTCESACTDPSSSSSSSSAQE